MPGCYSLGSRIRSLLRDYDRIQDLAVVLIYIQIGCALIGSLGALFNGVLLINLVVALFALVTIESSSQSLGRTYAVLLFCAIVLDVAWFILFSQSIWNFAPEKYGSFFVFSLRLALSMQIIGFSVRFLSSFLWIQMYRLGPASVDNTAYREVDFDVRSSFLNPSAHEIARQNSNSDDFIGGAIYDPAYYSSLFEDGQDKGSVRENWAAFEPPKTTVKRSMQVQRSRVTADKPFLKAKEKFDSQIEKFAIQQKSNATRGSSSSYHLNEGILDGASKLAVEAHSNLGSKWAKDISGSPHILGLKSHPEVGMERTSTVPPSMSPSLSRISSSQSSTKELFDSPDLLSIEAIQSGDLSKPLAPKTVTNPRNTSSTFSSSISPINTRPVVVAKDQASKTLDLTSGGTAPTLSMPVSTERLADTSGSVSAVNKENNFSSPFTIPAFASAGLSGKTTEFNNMTTGNQSSDSTLNLAFQSKVSVPTSSSPPPFFSSKPPEAASMTPFLTPASLAPISFGKSSLSSKPTGITNQTASVSTSSSQSSPSSSPVSNQSQNSVIQIKTTLTPNSSSAKPFVMSSFDAKSGVSNQLATVSSLTSSPSGTVLSHAQKSSSTTFTSLSPASRSSTVIKPTLPVTSATVGSVHLDKVNSKSQPTESTASGEVVSEPKNESNLLRTSSDSTSVAESLSQPEIPSSMTVLSTSTEKYERLDISLSQEDEMEEEASDTTTLSLGSLGGFGLGSMPSSSASKPNPFGVSFLTANSSAASPPLTLTAPAGVPFRLASFSLPSAQPVQTSQPASSGGFSSGLGQPAQVGVGQQAFGSVIGSFGQSQQLGSGMPAIGFPSSSGFSGGLFSPAASTGGFAGAATGGGFTSAAPAGGGFAAAAKGEGFAGLTSSGGFAGAAARGGFGALPPGSGFASTAAAEGALVLFLLVVVFLQQLLQAVGLEGLAQELVLHQVVFQPLAATKVVASLGLVEIILLLVLENHQQRF